MADVLPLRDRPSWSALRAHYDDISATHLRDLFAADPGRAERFSADAVGLHLDYSKNRIDDETLRLLLALADESGLREHIDAMFRGDRINVSEDRSVLHVALRMPRDATLVVDGTDVVARGPRRPGPHGGVRRRRSARAPGPGTPASGSATSSTSGSAARTSAPRWPTRRCGSTPTAT